MTIPEEPGAGTGANGGTGTDERGGLLVSNPLASGGSQDADTSLHAWLDALERVAAQPRRNDARPAPRIRAPSAADVEIAPELRRLESWIGAGPLRQVSAYLEGRDGYDAFGLSRETLLRAFPFFYSIYRAYFRVQSRGHEHIPSEGPCVIAANHGGLLPFDGAMLVVDAMLHSDPPRLPRAILDRWAGTLPFVNVFFAKVGQVVGTHENFGRLLADGEPVLVFPEGVEGIRKPITQRYRLQPFHVGFIEHALRARAPVVPAAVLGSDDQAPILFDIKPLARLLGIPAAPVTPTFPWFGPLGLLPYPVRYRIIYGEPIHFHERFGADDARDPTVVRALANRVRRSVQTLIDRNR